MIMTWNKMGEISKIGRKLIVLTVAFSSVLTFFITIVQLVSEYQRQRAELDDVVSQIRLLLPPMAASVWNFDEEQIALGLEALASLPFIERATITTPNEHNRWSGGDGTSERLIRRSYPLLYEVRGVPQQIATLEVEASLDGIYARVLSEAITILIGNGVKTLLVVGFMFVLFRQMVTKRIEELARNFGWLFAHPLLAHASVPDDVVHDEPGDEIDSLRLAFEDMSRRLKLAAQDLHERNDQLLRENGERRQAEADLQTMVLELSRANVELERFAYVAAHDLQEPIRALVSFSQLLERRCGAAIAGEGKEYLDFIIAEAKRLSSLVLSLLDYSRSGGATLAVKEVECGAVVKGVLQVLAPLSEQAAAEIEVGPLPRLVADGVQLDRVFQNLIGNAIKYRRVGHPPKIRVSAERDGQAWRFAVADNGIGIEAQYHSYIFEVFRRLHTRMAFPGTGIGLAMCKRIVEGHGGRIWLSSVPGEGTTFFFTILDAGPEGGGEGGGEVAGPALRAEASSPI